MFSSAISVITKISLVICLIAISEWYIDAQQLDNSILQNFSWLGKPEAGKWEKHLKELEKAEKLLKKSNDKYLEIGSKENDGELDDDKKAKSIKKLEKDALDGLLESMEKYKSIYSELMDIIELKLEDEQRLFPTYKAMSDYLDLADMAYNQADKMEAFDKTEKLISANEYQLRAIESGINIFTSPSVAINGTQGELPEKVVPDDDIVIDAKLLEMYKKYQSDSLIQDPLTAYKLINIQEEGATYSTFEEIWKQYQNNEFETRQVSGANAGGTVVDSLSIDSTAVLAITEKPATGTENTNIPQFTNTTKATSEIKPESKDKSPEPGAVQKVIQQPAIDESPSEKNGQQQQSITVRKDNLYPQGTYESSDYEGSDYEFRVQIAASYTPLSINLIETIYQGGLPVIELKEGKYYKYQIKGFNRLSKAQETCGRTGVDNAYIEAYKAAKRVQLGEAARASIKGTNKTVPDKIEFAVQFAASSLTFSENRISEIYSYTQSYRIVYENGWYKYQVFAGENLENAFKILEELNIEKAFVVAYKNGHKFKLYNAIQEYKRNLP